MKFFQLLILAVCLFTASCSAQKPVTWTPDQLLQPADLAAALKDNNAVPVIISVGPGAVIPQSLDMGMAKDSENIQKLKSTLQNLPKDTSIVIYCGCCPFDKCPNIRPALEVLKEMKFTNYHLLNLATNIKTDWINKGYPVAE